MRIPVPHRTARCAAVLSATVGLLVTPPAHASYPDGGYVCGFTTTSDPR